MKFRVPIILEGEGICQHAVVEVEADSKGSVKDVVRSLFLVGPGISVMIVADDVEEVDPVSAEIHGGICPKCGGDVTQNLHKSGIVKFVCGTCGFAGER